MRVDRLWRPPLFACLLFCIAPLAHADLGNQSFEIRPDGSGLIDAAEMPPREIVAWELTAGSIDWTGSGLLAAAHGNFSIDLEGRDVLGAGVLEQSFGTTMNARYRVGFALAGNPQGGAAVKQLEVSVDGNTEQFSFDTTNTTSTDMGWVCEELEFTASGSNATISFESLLNSGFGPQIDLANVALDTELVNGDFEDKPEGSALISADEEPPREISGWSLVSGSIDWTGSSVLEPAAGSFSIDLEGRASLGPGVLVQSFPTVPNQRYRLDFSLAGNPAGGPAVKELRVAIDGDVSDFLFDTTGQTTTDLGWVPRTVVFRATGSSTTVSFRSLGNSGFGPTIDEVTVSALTACESFLEFPGQTVPALGPLATALAAGALLALGIRATRGR